MIFGKLKITFKIPCKHLLINFSANSIKILICLNLFHFCFHLSEILI